MEQQLQMLVKGKSRVDDNDEVNEDSEDEEVVSENCQGHSSPSSTQPQCSDSLWLWGPKLGC